MKEYKHGGSWNLGIRAWLWEPSRKDDRAHEKSTSCFENCGFGASLMTSRWVSMGAHLTESSGCTFTEQTDRKRHHCQSFRLHRPQVSHQPKPSRSWICSVSFLSAAARTAGEHKRELESSGAFSCSEMKPACVENETSQVTSVGESNSTPSRVRQLSREGVKNDWRDAKNRRSC